MSKARRSASRSLNCYVAKKTDRVATPRGPRKAITRSLGRKLLGEWLEERWPKLSDRERHARFARLTQLNPCTVYNLCDGVGGPSLFSAAAIERATDGEVDAMDWLEPIERPSARASR